MYKLKPSSKFKKDLKRVQGSGRKKSDLGKIYDIIELLKIPEVLPEKNRDHNLTGQYKGYRECHILPDLLLIYKHVEEAGELHLYRIGNHSELF